jgi:hypothetical protein
MSVTGASLGTSDINHEVRLALPLAPSNSEPINHERILEQEPLSSPSIITEAIRVGLSTTPVQQSMNDQNPQSNANEGSTHSILSPPLNPLQDEHVGNQHHGKHDSPFGAGNSRLVVGCFTCKILGNPCYLHSIG